MQLGSDFAASLEELPLNQWIGPVASGFGAHLVYITERIEPGKLPFERVKSDLFR
ncbi:peptidyl-prolyl cis-trans isomerase, partial [Eudoraea sp.]